MSAQRVCTAYVCGLAGVCTHQRWLVLICVYVLVVKLIQIIIIISSSDMTLVSSQLTFIHLSNPISLSLPFKLGPDCLRPIQ